ncbi:MAG: universal stress protein [Myxococcales bacterium]|nr:universal stress protein [Myxococcales bacterium]
MSDTCIVVATDFSDQANDAISHAAVIAKARNVELVLVHALSMPDTGYNLPYSYRVPEAYLELANEIRQKSEAKLDKEKKRLEGLGLRVSIRCEAEMPDRSILDAAKACDAGLIVIGSHGRKGLARFLLGSVAEHVARHAPCDVLVARGPAPEDGYHKLLVPTDFSEVGELVVEQAIGLVDGKGEVDLLHCWELPGAPVNYWGATDYGLCESINKGAEEFGSKWVSRFGTDDVPVVFSAERGDPRRSIEDRTKEHSYDLVVMGSHHRKGMQRLLLGSVAETTLRHVKTSVYITKPVR